MSITIAFPIGYKPVLKHGDHDQSSHGSWATGDLVENGTISKDSKLDKEISIEDLGPIGFDQYHYYQLSDTELTK